MDEYVAMFALSQQDKTSRILGCADGPACFNAEMHDCGHSVVSADPIYRFSAEEDCQLISIMPSTGGE